MHFAYMRRNSKVKLNQNQYSLALAVNTVLNLQQSSPTTNRLKILIKTGCLKSKDLIKPFFFCTKTWSSGMVVRLLEKVAQQPNSLDLSTRRKWIIWQCIDSTLLWTFLSNSFILLNPWCIRTRRFCSTTPRSFIIHSSSRKYCTPTRRIKRWLKKKYTTQSWR
jgi:hypothetical protein